VAIFKDAMSEVPTCVALIACLQDNEIYGCTISSLVSVDIRDSSEKIAFMLKRDSLIGRRIILNEYFTLNVLSTGQESLAKYYSGLRLPDLVTDDKWDIKNYRYANLRKAKVIFNCKFLNVFKEYNANIYVATVLESFINEGKSPLIYMSRNFLTLN